MKIYLQVFKFEELSEKAKERAIANNVELIYSYINYSIDDQLKEYYKPMLEGGGIYSSRIAIDRYDNVDIYFSEISLIELNKLFNFTDEQLEFLDNLLINKNHRNYLNIDLTIYDNELEDLGFKKYEELEAYINEKIMDFIREKESEIEKYIESEKEHYFSEEILKEYVFAGAYFTKEGRKL